MALVTQETAAFRGSDMRREPTIELAVGSAPLVAVGQQPWAHQLESRIGSMLIDSGKLSIRDAERVLHVQKELGLRFGEAAVKLGLISEHDIQQVLSLQFSYPSLVPGDSAVALQVVAAYQSSSKAVESLRAIRSQLMVRWFAGEQPKRTLAIVSVARGEGRSYVTANLGVVFSQLGERTLIVDADMRNPAQHRLFGLENQIGLSAVLADRAGREVIQRIPELRDLSVLTAGATPPNAQDLLGRPAFARMLDELNPLYDVILVDTPCAATTDVDVIAARTCGAMLVTGRNRTRVRAAKDLVTRLRDARCDVVGGVVNER
jgi:receptor protein-tyrosine kinase